MNEPRVSVIMPAFNGQLYIDEAIRSVLSQTYKNWELVLVNDGSTDGTESVIKKYLSEPRIVYIKQENKGMAAARNAGIRAAGGQLIAFLDQDDFWLEDKLQLQVKYLAAHPGVFMLHGACNILKAGKISTPLKYHPLFSGALKGFVYNKLIVEDFVCVPTIIVRKEVFSEIGLFDESMIGVDDWDLCIRISKKYEIGYINKILAVYRHNELGFSKDIERWRSILLGFIEKNIFDNPEISAKIQKKAVSSFYKDVAYLYFCKGLYKKAAKNALSGMKCWPLNYKLYRLYLMICAAKIFEVARSFALPMAAGEDRPDSRPGHL